MLGQTPGGGEISRGEKCQMLAGYLKLCLFEKLIQKKYGQR